MFHETHRVLTRARKNKCFSIKLCECPPCWRNVTGMNDNAKTSSFVRRLFSSQNPKKFPEEECTNWQKRRIRPLYLPLKCHYGRADGHDDAGAISGGRGSEVHAPSSAPAWLASWLGMLLRRRRGVGEISICEFQSCSGGKFYNFIEKEFSGRITCSTVLNNHLYIAK